MNPRLALALAATVAVAVGIAGYATGMRVPTGSGPTAAATLIDEMSAVLAPRASAQDGRQSTVSDAQRAEIEAIIREYLISNPEIIREAINALQRKEDEAERVAQTQTIIDNSERLFSAPIDVAIGNPDGDVTLVEFFDYNCGYCKRAHADMQALLDNDPNLKIVLKEFPILGEGSLQAAQVSVAVLLTAPERYREFQDALLTEPGQADRATALAVAGEMGLDSSALSAMLDSDEVRAAIGESHALARELELTGTPSYVTSRKVIVGAVGYEALKQEIDTVRACAQDVAAC